MNDHLKLIVGIPYRGNCQSLHFCANIYDQLSKKRTEYFMYFFKSALFIVNET